MPVKPSLMDQVLKNHLQLTIPAELFGVNPFRYRYKNTEIDDNKGYDASKKASGIKNHLVVDINVFPQTIH